MAKHPRVYVKVSELASVSKSKTYPFTDAYPMVKRVHEAFGPDRLMCGSDWPVSLLNDGDYVRVWKETRGALERAAPDELDALLAGTARRLYGLGSS